MIDGRIRRRLHAVRAPECRCSLEWQLGQSPEAEKLFTRAVAENPRHVPALLNLAALARQRGDLTAALDYCGRALEIEPRRWQILLDLRNLLIAQGKSEEAARRWDEAVRLAGSEERVREELRRAGSAAALPEASEGL